MDENKRLLDRLHVLEEIQKAYRRDSTSIHREVEIEREVNGRSKWTCAR